MRRLPLDTCFFKRIEDDLLDDGALDSASRAWVTDVLRGVPLWIGSVELKGRALEARDWYAAQIAGTEKIDSAAAGRKAKAAIQSLFDGWREPTLRIPDGKGGSAERKGIPLRAMLAYLFGEVAKNFHLVRHPAEWIGCVTASQRGDRCVEIDPARLPDRAAMECDLAWEQGAEGPDRLNTWLDAVGAAPFDFNAGLDDAALAAGPPEYHRIAGSNFFRGLALIDLAEAMLHRAFGADAVAVRVNAAGQGDFFQVHVDTQRADPADVKAFLRVAFYRRFGLAPDPEFVEPHPGGGAVGVRLARYDLLPDLIRRLTPA